MRATPMIALVLADIPNFGFHATACLGAAGIRSDVLCTHRAVHCRWSRYCRRVGTIDRVRLLALDATLADEIAAVARERGAGVVVPADLESALLLSTCRDRFHSTPLFPLPPADLLLRLHHKPSFAQVVAEAGVAQPRAAVLNSPDDLPTLGLRYPLVLKPPASSCSHQVYLAAAPADADAHLRSGLDFPRLAQEFVPGSDLDLTTLSDHGRLVAWTIQRRLPGGDVEFFRHDAALDAGRRILEHTGFHGIADFDLRVDSRDGSVQMIECNPRFPGSLLFKLWAGVNLVHLGVLLAAGSDVSSRFTPATGRCTDMAIAPVKLLRSLARGRPAPPGLSEYSRRSWTMNLRDPVPHLLRAWQGRTAHGAKPASLGPASPPRVLQLPDRADVRRPGQDERVVPAA